jgi:hypothetical protein
MTRLTHGIASFKQVQLNLRGQVVSVHDYYLIDATQHMLLLSQGGARLAVALRPVELHPRLPSWQGLCRHSLFGRLGFLSALPE